MQIETNRKLDSIKIIDFARSKNEPEWMLNIRLNALKRFNEFDLKFLRYGLYAISNVENVKVDNINFLNVGKINIKNEGLIIEDMHSALEGYDDIIRKYFTCLVKAEDKFTALNLASWSKGLFIYADKNLVLNKDIEIDIDNQISYVLIIAEELSKFNIVFNNKNGNGFKGEIIEIVAKENSNVNIINLQDLNENVDNFSVKRAFVERDANVNFYEVNLGGRFNKIEASAFLNGIGASSKNYSLFLGNNEQFFDFLSNTIHNEKNTSSDMLSKGILNDKAKAIYNGGIHIKNNAGKSSGYQKFDALLLSKDCGVDPIPKLEIDTDDVKCSHGATITYADKEKLFYLMSRGLTEEEARKELVNGFIETFINKAELDKYKEKINEIIVNKLK